MFKSYDSNIEVKRSELEGRYIIAARDIDAGEDLLKCKAYFSMTSEAYKKMACANCVKSINKQSTFQQNQKIKPVEYKCNQCNEIWYCSELCKIENQPIHTHYECKFFKRFRAPKLSECKIDSDTFTEIRMIVGLLSRYYQDKILKNSFNLSNYINQKKEQLQFENNQLQQEMQQLNEQQQQQQQSIILDSSSPLTTIETVLEKLKLEEERLKFEQENLNQLESIINSKSQEYSEIQDTLDDIFSLVENSITEESNKAAKDLIDIITDFISNLFNLVVVLNNNNNNNNNNNCNIDNNNNNNDLDSSDNSNNSNKESVSKIISVTRSLIHKVRCNQFGIWTKSDKCLAVAISPSSSYFNHSCIPNCINIRDGNKMTFKSLYPVKKGEQLAISYLELDQPTQQRKDYLKYGYYFDCLCPRCDDTINADELMDNWISKFYCKKPKCTGLYYSKSRLILDQFDISDKIKLLCSDCSNELIVKNSYFNNSPFPLNK